MTLSFGAGRPARFLFLAFKPGLFETNASVSVLRPSAETDHPGTANMVGIRRIVERVELWPFRYRRSLSHTPGSLTFLDELFFLDWMLVDKVDR